MLNLSTVLKYASNNRGYLMSKSAALLLLKRKVPDVLTEIPLRPLDIDYKGEEVLSLQEECLMPGWHFFYKGVLYDIYFRKDYKCITLYIIGSLRLRNHFCSMRYTYMYLICLIKCIGTNE